MTDTEVLELLRKIDDGYKTTDKDRKELLGIEKIRGQELIRYEKIKLECKVYIRK